MGTSRSRYPRGRCQVMLVLRKAAIAAGPWYWWGAGGMASQEHALLFYYPHTAVTSTAPAAEHFTIRDGKIVEIRLVFDRLSFAPPEQR